MKIFRRTAALLAAGAVILLSACGRETLPDSDGTSADPQPSSAVSTTREYPDSLYVDFDKYLSVNREVYAYISVPGTDIAYPVLQSGADDNYYLRRDWKGKSSYRGCIFSQSANGRDFADPVTVLYGHNTDKGDMFSELLNFADKDFFDEHDTIYICQPGRILTYKIFSAHTYDNRHILNSYNFADPSVFLSFENEILSPDAIKKNVRQGTELNEDSRILILSTCAEARSGSTMRFLVNGVLIKDAEIQ